MNKSNIKTIFELIVIGLAIGWITTTICMWIFNGCDSTIKQMTCWLVCSMIFGATTIIFDKMSLFSATLIHFLITITIVSANSYLLGYDDSFFSTFTTVFPAFIIIYAIIYLICTLIWKNDARQINQKLKNK